MFIAVVEIELHDEVDDWIDGLDDADLGSRSDSGRQVDGSRLASSNAFVEVAWRGFVRVAVHARFDGSKDHLSVYERRPDRAADNVSKTTQQRTLGSSPCS
jgi:hypothetical protein